MTLLGGKKRDNDFEGPIIPRQWLSISRKIIELNRFFILFLYIYKNINKLVEIVVAVDLWKSGLTYRAS